LRRFIEYFGNDKEFYNLVLSKVPENSLSGSGAKVNIVSLEEFSKRLPKIKKRFSTLEFHFGSE